MSRPIRIEFPGALYHVTARGDRREDIFDDDVDRQAFLDIFAQVVKQFNWLCYAWCLLDNHYHLLIQTPDANLSKCMRQLNGVFTQTSNRRYQRVGHEEGNECYDSRPDPLACLSLISGDARSSPAVVKKLSKPSTFLIVRCRTLVAPGTVNLVDPRIPHKPAWKP